MFLPGSTIEKGSFVNDIVKQNYHAADVFRRYNIEYCCGGRWPLETVCTTRGIDFEQLKKELETAGRIIRLSPGLPYHSWDVDFLTSYIINVHHHYLKTSMPVTGEMIKHFADGHEKKYPYMNEVYRVFEKLQKDLI